MAPKKTLLERMRDNPRADWDISAVQRVCEEHAVDLMPPSAGSHYKAKSPFLQGILTIPAHRPIKAPYIRSLVSMIDAHNMMKQKASERKK